MTPQSALNTNSPGGTTLAQILIIDDDEVFRYVLHSHLTKLSYSVLMAPDGKVGLDLVNTSKPEAVFLDLNMPEMNGFEVLEALRADERTRSVPVIVNTSAQLMPPQVEDLRKRGASAVLQKNENFPETALQTLQTLLAVKGRQ